jgi:preprotein translocase subunit SecB
MPDSQQADQGPVFQIQRIYLKEASLEQPNSPGIFVQTEQPGVEIHMGVEAQPVVEGVFEVALTATLQAASNDKTVFLVEVKQAGIFEIRNLPDDQMGPVLSVSCPQIIYPYLRSNVADMVQRAGFPPVHLSEINFQSMYEQNRLQQEPATVRLSELR